MLKEKLENLANGSGLRQYVIDEILENVDNYTSDSFKENLKSYFEDLHTSGCQGGFVGPLIYYTDTNKFYDEHYDEIEELREEWEESVGQPLEIKGDLKNFYAWFAFEETARNIANELGLEV